MNSATSTKTPLRQIFLSLYTRAKKTQGSLPEEMRMEPMEALRTILETHQTLSTEEGDTKTAAQFGAMLAVANKAKNEGDLIRLAKTL